MSVPHDLGVAVLASGHSLLSIWVSLKARIFEISFSVFVIGCKARRDQERGGGRGRRGGVMASTVRRRLGIA